MTTRYQENVGPSDSLTPDNADEAKGWPYAMVFREHLPSWGHLLDTSMAYAINQMSPPREGN